MNDIWMFLLRSMCNMLIMAWLYVTLICSGHELYDLLRNEWGGIRDVGRAAMCLGVFALALAALVLISGSYSIWGLMP